MKAILIVDMPDDWPCTEWCVEGDLMGKNEEGYWMFCNEIVEAPLKPMPEEEMADAIPVSFLKDKIALNESWGCYGYAKGLQSAIDEWEKQNDRART